MNLKNKKGIALIEIIIIIFIISVIIVLIKNTNKVYENSNIDKTSIWYVNDLYMSDQFYYNNILNEKEKEYYLKIFNSIKDIKKELIIEKCDSNTIQKVLDAISCDHPELINYTSCSWIDSGNETRITFDYITESKEKLESMVKKVQKKIAKIEEKTRGKEEYEKELYVYEWLAETSRYGSSYDSKDQSAYTAFTSIGNTVCAGYGKAAQIIFQNIGIKSYILRSEKHLWNMVSIDNEYYYFDVSCACIPTELYMISYSGLNPKDISSYDLLYSTNLPEVNGNKYDYYDYNNLTITYDPNNLEELKALIDNSEYKVVEIKFANYSDFFNSQNIVKVADKLGIEQSMTSTNSVIRMRKK